MIVLGFTGTRRGMTDAQRDAVRAYLERVYPFVVVHGACVGADHDMHELVRDVRPSSRIVVLPSNLAAQTCMHCVADADDHAEKLKSPLARNLDIVLASKIMLATPAGFEEERRSGTWYTLRRARLHRRPFIIVRPDGTTKHGVFA